MATLKTPYFWTDHVQANERLTGTFVLLDDEPIFVRSIIPSERAADPCPSLDYLPVGGDERERVRLDDPKFKRFRKLPVLGWVNYEKSRTGVLLERKPVRNRQHGLSDSNTMAGSLGGNGGRDAYHVTWGDRPRYSDVASDKGYASACKGDYPALADVITHIRENTTIAVSPLFAVYRDELGIRWLYRLSHRIGVISGADSLLLLDKYKFMREELTEDPVITVQNIREF